MFLKFGTLNGRIIGRKDWVLLNGKNLRNVFLVSTFPERGESRSAKFKVEKGCGSKDCKPTCANCDEKHYGESILGAES